MQTPKVPKVEKPKTPIDPQEDDESKPLRERSRNRGRPSAVSAGKISTRANTRKSSLLGGS